MTGTQKQGKRDDPVFLCDGPSHILMTSVCFFKKRIADFLAALSILTWCIPNMDTITICENSDSVGDFARE